MLNKFLKYLAVASVLGAAVIKGETVTLDYTKEGVLRKESQCNVNFVNFGIKNDITNLSVQKEQKSGYFNLKISNLKNGNLGLNKSNFGYTFDNSELKKYIKISQNNVNIQNFDVTASNNGKFSLTIKNLNTCEGLTVKQTFKEPVAVATYLLYSNVKPGDNTINQGYDQTEFGPSSNDVPYDTVHWDMNTGLDGAREKCRIYIEYKEMGTGGGNHWRWYLSTDNINGEKCDNTEFFKSVRSAYTDYDVMDELFGDHYEGYVIKREGGDIAHMDGILHNQNYLIEIYQDGCNEQNKDQVICTISSKEKLTFKQFEEEFVENCLSVIIDQDEEAKWKVNSSGASAIFSNYALNIVNNNRGALPNSEYGSISYKEFKGATSSGIARFSVSLDCGDGSYIGDKCRCNACPTNCSKCLNEFTCTECKEGSILVDGQCVCELGYKEDDEGMCTLEPITTTVETTTTNTVEETVHTTSTVEEFLTETLVENVTDISTSTIEETTTSTSTIEETTTSTSTFTPEVTTIEETITDTVEETVYLTSTVEELLTETIEETVTETSTSTIEETTTSTSTVEETTTSTSIVEETTSISTTTTTTPVEEVQESTTIPAEDTTSSIESTTSTAQPTEEPIIPSDDEETPIPEEVETTPVMAPEPEEEPEEEPDNGTPFAIPLSAAAFAGLAGAAAAVYYKSKRNIRGTALADEAVFESNAGLQNPLYEGSAAQSENPLYESNFSMYST